ncbi:hypothetical protein NQ317_019029, partial [Molorchus minor]
RLIRNRQPKKLIQDVSTRWNSTFFMVKRFVELEEPIKTTVAVISKDMPIISVEEWDFLKEVTKILKPMETVTNIISGEKYVTASSVIILTHGMTDVYKNLRTETITALSTEIIDSILNGIQKRLGDLENSNSLINTTILDPRYKDIGFSNTAISEKAKNNVKSLIIRTIKNKQDPQLIQINQERQEARTLQVITFHISNRYSLLYRLAVCFPCIYTDLRLVLKCNQLHLVAGCINGTAAVADITGPLVQFRPHWLLLWYTATRFRCAFTLGQRQP